MPLTGSLTTDEQRVVDAAPKDLLVGGERRAAEAGRSLAVDDPATGRQLAEVADASPADAMAALGAADAAQAGWASTPARERGEILRRSWQLMTERVEDLALLMTLEMGKSLEESRGEVRYAAEFFRWFGEEAVRVRGSWSADPAGSGRLITMRQPVGPCVLVTPWNFPLAMGTRKIGPAVAAGCTMIVKPAAETPLSMLALAALMAEAGLPDGVLSVLPTSDAGAAVRPLLEDPRTRKLSFTGSTPVGRELMRQASGRLLRLSMELGGNAPFLVFDDADLDAAVDGAVVAKMRNIGQSCVAANRFHVQQGVYDEFCARLADRLAALEVGRGTGPGSPVGPLITRRQRDKVTELVGDAVARGATVLTGGAAVDGPGAFFAPTVLRDVAAGSRCLAEEVFGPVAPVTPFGSEDEGLALANASEVGLVAYAFTRDLARGVRVMEGLQTGMVGLNRGLVSNPAAPFGGVKQSGFGREGGEEGIEEYVNVKYVALQA
jgi:succinate-semialdehyde dehydrogenase/glutarate-semialdehyde dehydrogenase